MAKSHPTYDAWGKKPELTLEERQERITSYPAFSERRYKLEEEFHKKYGRGWIQTRKVR